MATGEPARVAVGEVLALLREATRLVQVGAGATVGERESYQRRKADLLARVADCEHSAAEPDTAPGLGGSSGER